nr:acyl-CoA dehydrogenase N-terminal domain-containing protein [Novosphingobium sp.]
MPIYQAPTRDTRFLINEVIKLDSYRNLPGFEDATADMI